jgi:hypothetical protein
MINDHAPAPLLTTTVTGSGKWSITGIHAPVVSVPCRERIPANAQIIMNYFIYHFPELVFVTLLCTVMGIVVTGFTIYNSFLAATNVTANEAGKWRDAASYRDEAVARYRKWKRARDSGKPLPPPAHVVLCATGACSHERHAGNKGKPAPTEWILEEPSPLPKNAYDRGLLRNIAKVLFPQDPLRQLSSSPPAGTTGTEPSASASKKRR